MKKLKFFSNPKVTPAPKEATWQGIGQAQVDTYLQNIASEQQILEDELRAEVYQDVTTIILPLTLKSSCERTNNLNEMDNDGACNCCKICQKLLLDIVITLCHTISMTHSHNIMRPIREQLGYTQVALAELLQVSQPAVQLWEDGSRKLPITIAKRLIKISCNKYTLDDIYQDSIKD